MSALQSSWPSLLGVSAMVDHQSAALSDVADFAAALSCEASKADVTAFDLMDGHACKDRVGVCSDMNVLLHGAKLAGKVKIESVSKIPPLHGAMREVVGWVHSVMQVLLNWGVQVGTEEMRELFRALLKLAGVLRFLGEFSMVRVKTNLASMASNELRSSLEGIFAKKCPAEADSSLFSELGGLEGAISSFVSNDVRKFASEVKMLLETVWNIVAWEVVTAFAALEPVELTGKIQAVGANGDNTKPGKKKKEEKKKKQEEVVLGKGNSVILQLIKDRLQKKRGDAVDMSGLLEIWVGDFLSLFYLKDPEFDVFLSEIKDFIESAEVIISLWGEFSYGGHSFRLEVPMVRMPKFVDQIPNAYYVEEVWKVGVNAKKNEEGAYGKEEIERCLRELMYEEKGKEIKKNLKQMKQHAIEAVSQGGSSDMHIEEFIARLVHGPTLS